MKKLFMTTLVVVITAIMMFTVAACSKTNAEFKADYKEVSKEEVTTLKTNIDQADAVEVKDTQLSGYQLDVVSKSKIKMMIKSTNESVQASNNVYLDSNTDINMTYKYKKGEKNIMSADTSIKSKNSGLLYDIANILDSSVDSVIEINEKAYYDGTNLYVDNGKTKIKTTTTNYNSFLESNKDFDFEKITEMASSCEDILGLVVSGKIESKYVKVAIGDFGTKIKIDIDKDVITALMGSEVEGLKVTVKSVSPMYFSFDKDFKLRGFDISYEMSASGEQSVEGLIGDGKTCNVSMEIKVDATMVPFDGTIKEPSNISEYVAG